jgi:hypothetical protein
MILGGQAAAEVIAVVKDAAIEAALATIAGAEEIIRAEVGQ